MINFTCGADPETFVCTQEGNVKSIIGKIGGTKELPLGLPIGDGFAVQEDNVALEFNVPPAHNRAEFIANIAKATGFLEQLMIDQHGLRFSHESAVSFPEEEMYAPAAFEFGCEPDFDAWTGRVNRKPRANDPLLRSAGGHVHIGNIPENFDIREVIKACDLFLGVPATILDNGIIRKELYGKRGAYRKKPFGVEYRVLSNFWIFDEKLIGWVHDAVGLALEAVSVGIDLSAEEENIKTAINDNNKEVALQLIEKYGIKLP